MATKKPAELKTIAVTGAAGSLGEAVLDQLVRRFPQAKIRALDIAKPHRRRDPKQIEFVRCDVRDKNLGEHFKDVDAIIHLAFIVDKVGSLSDSEIRAINVGGTQNVFLSGVAAGVKQFVYASSIAAYGMHAENNSVVLTEESPTRGNPDFFYSCHKAEVEAWLNGFEKENKGVRIARLRPSIFLGERSPTRPVRFLAYVPVIPGLGGFDHVRMQLTHEDDIASAFVLALEKRAHGAYNLAAEGTVNTSELGPGMGKLSFTIPKPLVWAGLYAGMAAHKLGWSPWDPDWLIKAGRANVIVSARKAREELGWQPRYDTAIDVLRAVVGNARAA